MDKLKNKKTFCIGDIHGGYRALIQVLVNSGFDYENDTLISLGDLADGWSETHLVIEELKKIKNLILLRGNHDEWACRALITEIQNTSSIYDTSMTEEYEYLNKYFDATFYSIRGEGSIWYKHGGIGTEFSYKNNPHLIIDHVSFLDKALDYYIDDNNRFFSHCGPDPYQNVEETKLTRFYWNREFWQYSISDNLTHKKFREHINRFREIYIGHTPTKFNYPTNVKNVWNMDTGSCFDGVLSIMDIDSKEIFQSDIVRELYPNEIGRMDISYNNEQKV